MNIQYLLFRWSLFLLITLQFFFPLIANSYELTANISLEGRGFLHSPDYPRQKRHNASLAIMPELYHEFSTGSSLIITPFLRLDSSDDERTHWDIREANYLYLAGNWEVRAGVGKVFWGATEFVHLVDIINQTDLVESLDGEEKLGQPMVHLSVPGDWGIIDAFLLPWFRERTYPGEKGRLRYPLVVDSDHASYESGAEENNLDLALRYSHTLADADFGLYHYVGTSRQPTLLPGMRHGVAVLFPYYQQIQQTGFDVQMVVGNWLCKGEGVYRSGQGRSFAATTFGFEYTFIGISESSMDLGIIGEYIFDDRESQIASPYNNDIMAGLRLAVNDADGTEILAGMIKDINESALIFSIEASRRLGERWKVNVEAAFFTSIDEFDPACSLRDDDLITAELVYYF
jgi:hypothetical protein